MRKLKKFFALALSLVMMVSMMVPAAFADTAWTLTIADAPEGHTYEAYQILAGTVSDDGLTLSNPQWGLALYYDADGDGTIEEGDYDKVPDLITAIFADTAVIPQGTGTTTLAAKFTELKKLTTTDSDNNTTLTDDPAPHTAAVKAFAEDLAELDTYGSLVLDRLAEVINDCLQGSSCSATSTYDKETGNYTLTGDAVGYYLVKDKDGTQDGAVGGFYTKYIVKLLKGETTQEVKGEGTKVVKTISDSLNATYEKIKDFDIQDTVYYKWDGTLPSNYSSYDKYVYEFTDSMPEGITFKQIEAIYVVNESNTNVSVFDFFTNNGENIPTDGVYFTNTNKDATITLTQDTDSNKITMTFSDLKKLNPNINSSHQIVVKYSATVDADVLLSTNGTISLNTNSVTLKYSNNPDGDGFGYTVPDEAHFASFQIEVLKYDLADPTMQTTLKDVEFQLYWQDINGNKEYAVAGEGNKLTGYTTDVNKATTFKTGTDGKFQVNGLDAGTYYLVETKEPNGYHKLNSPIQIIVTPDYTKTVEKDDGKQYYEYTVKVDGELNKSITVGVANAKGAVLPSTGGIGTTIFYVAGGALVVAALVLLITKKRMNADN